MAKSQPPRDRYGSIDENLRRAYDEVLKEGVPDRFNDLLKRLKDGDIPSHDDREQN